MKFAHVVSDGYFGIMEIVEIVTRASGGRSLRCRIKSTVQAIVVAATAIVSSGSNLLAF